MCRQWHCSGLPGSREGEGTLTQSGAGKASQGHELWGQPSGLGRGLWLPGPDSNTCQGQNRGALGCRVGAEGMGRRETSVEWDWAPACTLG